MRLDGSDGSRSTAWIRCGKPRSGAPCWGRSATSHSGIPCTTWGWCRLHFDIPVDDVDAATARVVELGGSIVSHEDIHEYGFSWRLAADPEGNEFCLIY